MKIRGFRVLIALSLIVCLLVPNFALESTGKIINTSENVVSDYEYFVKLDDNSYKEAKNTYDDNNDYTPYDKANTEVKFYIVTTDGTKFSSDVSNEFYTYNSTEKTLTFRGKEYAIEEVFQNTENNLSKMLVDGKKIFDYTGSYTTPVNRTLFIDEGDYTSDTGTEVKLSQTNFSIVGLSKTNGEPNVTITSKPYSTPGNDWTDDRMWRFGIFSKNVYIENVIFDGQNKDMMPAGKVKTPYIPSSRGEALIFIGGAAGENQNTAGNPEVYKGSEGLVLKDITIQNVGKDNDDSDAVSSSWFGTYTDPKKLKKNRAIEILRTRGQHNFEDIRIKNIKTTDVYSTIFMHNSSDNYFKDIDFDGLGVNPKAQSIQVENSYKYEFGTPSEDINNHFVNINYPDEHRFNSIYLQSSQYKKINLDSSYRYILARNYESFNDINFKRSYRAYKNSSIDHILETINQKEGTDNLTNTPFAFWDLRDNYWVVTHNDYVSLSDQILSIALVVKNSNGELTNSRKANVPSYNIKIVANKNGEIEDFSIPEIVSTRMNIVAVKDVDTLVTKDLKTLIPLQKNGKIKLARKTSESDVDVKLYNFDFDKEAKYTLHQAIREMPVLAEDGSVNDIGSKVLNSYADASNFVNCKFTVLYRDFEVVTEDKCGKINIKVDKDKSYGYTYGEIPNQNEELYQLPYEKITDNSLKYEIISGSQYATVDENGTINVIGKGSIEVEISANDIFNEGEIDKPTRTLKLDVDNEATLTFDANGGTNRPNPITTTKGSVVVKPSGIPTREGFEFINWTTSASATSVVFDFSNKICKDTTVYAQWNELETTTKERKVEKILDFDTEYKDDDTMNEGETKVCREGRQGLETITYTDYYKGDKLVKTTTGATTTVEPTNKIICVGTKKPIGDVETVKKIENIKTIPYKTIYKESDSLEKGVEKICRVGVAGSATIVYYEHYINGDLIKTTTPSTTTVIDAVDEIICVGTKIKEPETTTDQATKVPSTPTGSYYPNVPKLNKEDHFAYMFGYPDRSFKVDGYITRAEVSAMFARLMLDGIDDDIVYSNSFNDIPSNAWYAKTVGFMESKGIIKGYVDGSFRPDEPITRAEFAAVASRFDELKLKSNIKFNDLSDEHWASDYVNMSATRGWIKGYPDDSFKPENHITRAEALTVTNRMLYRSADKKYVDTHKQEIVKFDDLLNLHWAYYDVMEAANGHDYTRNSDGSETWLRIRDLGEVINTK